MAITLTPSVYVNEVDLSEQIPSFAPLTDWSWYPPTGTIRTATPTDELLNATTVDITGNTVNVTYTYQPFIPIEHFECQIKMTNCGVWATEQINHFGEYEDLFKI